MDSAIAEQTSHVEIVIQQIHKMRENTGVAPNDLDVLELLSHMAQDCLATH